jgi:hypothetical protein
MGYSRYHKVVGQEGLYVGAKGSEVLAVSSTGVPSIAGTALTATGAELNGLDVSAQTETLVGAGAVSGVLTQTSLALVGAGAVTLAAPTAAMVGRIKIISMTVDNGDVTLALTNCSGGTAATTCTWSAVGQALVLVAGLTKWCVVSEAGVVLT